MEIAYKIYSYLYLCAPPLCPEAGRTRTPEQINDILQGRDKTCGAEAFLAEMDATCHDWPDYKADRKLLRQLVRAFLRKKERQKKLAPPRKARQPPARQKHGKQ